MLAKYVDLLLLPGLICDSRLWHAQISGLAEVARAKVADLTGADSIPALAAAALAQAPAERFALAGLSMGGYVALEIMRQAPDRVVALALIDTSARPDPPEAREGRLNLIKLAETDYPAVIEALLPKLLHPSHLNNDSIMTTVRAMAQSVGSEACKRQIRAIIGRIDSRPFLGQIRCPAVVLCGRQDAITPIEVHEEMKRAIPQAGFSTFEGCGHLSTLEQPEQVTDALRSWLAPLNAAASMSGRKSGTQQGFPPR